MFSRYHIELPTTTTKSFKTDSIFLLLKFQVDKIRIAYAKTAKRIDIKKLKKAMWESLSTSKGDKDKVCKV